MQKTGLLNRERGRRRVVGGESAQKGKTASLKGAERERAGETRHGLQLRRTETSETPSQAKSPLPESPLARDGS
jgi:hypothetical protein